MTAETFDRGESPRPAPRSTFFFLTGLAATMALSTSEKSAGLASQYAIGIGLSLVVSILADLRGNVRNLVRADIMALGSLYFLTLAEFLVPQPEFEVNVGFVEARLALQACMAGFAAIALGRHFTITPPRSLMRLTRITPPRGVLILLFTLCLVGGYSNMIAAVNYDFGLMIDFFMAPRFAQPWGRGRFGDWRALLYEIGMVLYLVPPIAGVVLADRKRFALGHLIYVGLGLAFTFFYGYSSGTRNIFATYLATFLVAYAFAAGRERRKEVLAVVAIGAAAMIYATTTMLEFRNIGFYNYINGRQEREVTDDRTRFFIDNNLFVLSRLVQLFPGRYDFLTWEIPYLAIVRPIPRAFWASKPEGMSISIEEALGAGESYTLAATFIGEAYMSGGTLGVVLYGLFFGMIMSWWNRLGSDNNSAFGYLIYASGFFAAVISMRSLLVFTTAILPTAAAIIFGHWIVQAGFNRRSRRQDAPTDA